MSTSNLKKPTHIASSSAIPITPAAIQQDIQRLVLNRQCKHDEVFNLILDQLQPINFSEQAKIESGKQKLAQKHYLIITIEEVLNVAREHGWDLCRSDGLAYIFNGAYWQTIDNDALRSFLGRCAQKLSVSFFDAKHYKFQDELVKQFFVSAHFEKLKKSPDAILINLLNGTLEVKTTGSVLRQPRKEDFLTYQLPFDYDEAATCPKFESYLNHVLPDQSCQHILAEYIGRLFIPSDILKLEKVLLLYGTGANGKSVFFEVINALLGPENISHQTLQNLTDVERGGSYRAKLAGKLLNYGSEITSKMDPTLFKAMASGEPVEARALYGQPFSLINYARLLFNCNELPRDVEHTEGFFRRLLIVPFEITIPEHEQDRELSRKIIESELSGILNWALNGMKQLLQQKNFTESKAVQEKLAQFRKESDSVSMFLEDAGFIAGTDYMLLSAFMNDYQTYCKNYGQIPCSGPKVSKRLKHLGFKHDRNKSGMLFYLSKQL